MEINKEELARFSITRMDGYFNVSNVKASLLITTNAVIMGTSVTSYLSLIDNVSLPSVIPYIKFGLSLTVILAIISTVFSLQVIFSYLKSGSRTLKYHSLIFFGSISQLDEETYIEEFSKASDEDHLNDILRQVYVLSRGLESKFKNVNRSVVFSGLSILMLAISGMLIYWG